MIYVKLLFKYFALTLPLQLGLAHLQSDAREVRIIATPLVMMMSSFNKGNSSWMFPLEVMSKSSPLLDLPLLMSCGFCRTFFLLSDG